jgi:transcriptional regulator with XRE-family HTH domain
MKTKIWPYPVSMPKRKYQLPKTNTPFRDRLIQLRKASGLSQKEFAQAVGISSRMAAYYETETQHPPTHLLAVFAKVLGVTTDQLLGIEKVKTLKQRDSRLRRLTEEIEQLPASRRKQVAQLMEDILKASKNEKGKDRPVT